MGRRKKEATDHHGNVYPSVEKMCEAYKISYSVFYQRTEVLHWNLEMALTTPIKKRTGKNRKVLQETEKEFFQPKSRQISAEYVRYLQWKIEELRKRRLELPKEGEAVELSQELAVYVLEYEKRIEIIQKEAYWFHNMDMYIMYDEEDRKRLITPKNRILMVAKLDGVLPMTELEKDIYVDFNKKYRIVEEVQEFRGLA